MHKAETVGIKTLVSTFSTQNLSSALAVMTCPSDAPWANCLDVTCHVDIAHTAATTALLAEFNAYLDHDDADPAADQVGYQQRAIWLTRDELHAMITGLQHAIAPLIDNPATPDRTQYLISPILFPAEKPSSPS
jgi:hypothetical protein